MSRLLNRLVKRELSTKRLNFSRIKRTQHIQIEIASYNNDIDTCINSNGIKCEEAHKKSLPYLYSVTSVLSN